MKKTLLFLGLAAATLSLTNCNKQEVDIAGNAGDFSIRLVAPETRTVNDGLSTKWAEGDALTVFYATAGKTDYSENIKFDVSDPDAGVAKGEVSLSSGSYDWYAFYPYNSYFTTPANDNEDPARTYIGGRSDRSQTQTGYDSKAHLAGTAVPVYGVAKGVSSSSAPEIHMKHIAAVAEIVVTNKSGKAVTITGVDLSAPADVDIVGQYNISFDAEPVITKYNTYQSNTAKLAVEGGSSLANGASAKFYLVVKPFEAKDLTVKVTTDAGFVEKSVSLSSAASFQAGHIKTLNVPFDKAETAGSSTIAEMLAMADGEVVVSNEVLVVAKASVGIFVKEGNDYIYIYDSGKTAISDVKIGDKIIFEGTTGNYKGAKQITNPKITVKSSGTSVKHPTAKDITESFETYEASYAEALSFTGTLSVSGNYYNINVEGITSRVGSIVAPAVEDADAVNALDKKNVQVTGYYLYITGKYFYVIATEVKEAEGGTPSGPEEGTITIPRTKLSMYVGDVRSLEATTNSTASITYTSSDPSIASVDSEGNVTAVAEGETTITLTLPEVPDQFTADEKVVTITVSPQSGTVGGTWTKQSLSSISNGAQFVLVSSKDGQPDYAMSNDGSGSKQPMAVEVSISGTKLSSVSENMVWTLEKSGSSYIFHPGSNAEAWLYCTSNNNGLRTGTGETNVISLDSESGYLTIVDTKDVTRYIGVYYDNKDWRSYTSVNNNIKDQTFTFFVKQ